jgi:hypothetical protein
MEVRAILEKLEAQNIAIVEIHSILEKMQNSKAFTAENKTTA